LYQDSVTREEKRQSERLAALMEAYAGEMERLALQAQEAGHLDSLLLFRSEQKEARSGSLAPLPDTAPAALRSIRQRLDAARGSVESESQANRERLKQAYLAHLQQLQRSLTVNNRIEDAMAVRAEIQTLSGAAPPPMSQPPAENARPVTSLVWQRGQVEAALILTTNGQRTPFPFRHDGDIRVSPRGWECRGGRSLLEKLGPLLVSSFQATHELTLAFSLETASLDQKGPARILFLSKDTQTRNLTLGQDEDSLVLRLRTPSTGTNGSNPAIQLGKIEAGKPIRMVVTYRKGEVRLYRDGKDVEADNIRGDFSNWEPMDFMIGNEVGNERPWRGVLHRFELHNRVLEPDAARRLSNTP
jgi:hypothetical protein